MRPADAAVNLLDPGTLARRNLSEALRISAIGLAVSAALLLGTYGVAARHIAGIRDRKATENTRLAEARKYELVSRRKAADEDLDHVRAAASERGRAPAFLAWLGTIPWQGGRLTQARVDPATGRAGLVGLARGADFIGALTARLSAQSGLGKVRLSETTEEEVQGHKLFRYQLDCEGLP